VTASFFALTLLAAQVPASGLFERCGAVFGRCTFTLEDLSALPHGGTVWSILETIEPNAVTNRIDVAGIESGSFGLWGVRGSSWTQNLVRLDDVDVTDPAGGRPLLYPDVELLSILTFVNAAAGATAASPGAELQLVSRKAPGGLGGSAHFQYTGGALQSGNLTPRLSASGVEEREFIHYPAGRVELGGRGVYAAVSGFDLSSRIPYFAADVHSRLVSATGKLDRGRFSLLTTLQRLDQPEYGAAPRVSPGATVDAQESFQHVSARWSERSWQASFGFSRAKLDSAAAPATSPLFDLARTELRDAPLRVADEVRSRASARGQTEKILGRHALSVGGEWSRGRVEEQAVVPGNQQRLTVDGAPHAVSLFQGSGDVDVTVERFALWAEDTFKFRSLELSPGLRFDVSRSSSIHWRSASPTLAIVWSLGERSSIHASVGRYPHALTSRWEAVAAPQGLSSTWRRWGDSNGDRQVSPDEIGFRLRRSGPAFTTIAPDLPRPYTDEVSIGFERRFASGRFRMSGYHRREKNLLETVNVGINPESYFPFTLDDVGPDGVPGGTDDMTLTLYDQQAQQARDRFVLDQPEGLDSLSQGVDLWLAFHRPRWSFALAGRAYRDEGAAGPGNAVTENDTGALSPSSLGVGPQRQEVVPGTLFDDPNWNVNARGRLFFDRAFTGKLVVTAKGPRAIELAAVTRYWDGQPFARQIFLTDVGQGFTIVQAFPRGRLRYTFNMTVDFRVARAFQLGRASLDLLLDVFNAFNQTLEVEENPRTGSDFRSPTLVQPGRAVRLGLRLRF